MKINYASQTFKKGFTSVIILILFLANLLAFMSAQQIKNDQLINLDQSIKNIFQNSDKSKKHQLSTVLFEIKTLRLKVDATVITNDNEELRFSEYLNLPQKIDYVKILKNKEFRKNFQINGNEYIAYEHTLLNGDSLLLISSIQNIENLYRSNLKSNLINFNFLGLFSILGIAFLIIYLQNIFNKRNLKIMENNLGEIAHELRTPLTIIKGYSELIQGNWNNNNLEFKKAINAQHIEISRMEGLINDLLFLAEIREKLPLIKENLNLSELAFKHFEDFEHLNPSHNVFLEIQGNYPISANRDHLDRMFQNILSNIARHTEKSSKVKCKLIDINDEIILIIEDSGLGLSENFYENQEEALVRFDSSRSKSAGGSGLGLNIIYSIVKKNGGSLKFEKSSLGGLALRITFPKTLI